MINSQDVRCQRKLVRLPTEANEEDATRFYGAMGINVLRMPKCDDILLDAELPAGWRVKATDHSMWSEIIDSNGRKRISVFHKNSVMERSAYADIIRRYGVDFLPNQGPGYVAVDRATGQGVFRGGGTYSECRSWLDSNFPDHKNPLAYW